MPSLCLGASARYTQLVREKQRKMAELEKCMGATNGLKIAGISTLGLTAVGVVGNIAEAQKLNELDADIKKADEKIQDKEKEIATEQKKIKEEEEAKSEGRAALSEASYALNCRLSGGTPLGDDKCMCTFGKKPDSTGKCGYVSDEEQPTDPTASETAVGKNKNEDVKDAVFGESPKLNVDIPALDLNKSHDVPVEQQQSD